MRFPSIGSAQIPKHEPEYISVEDDLGLAEKQITKISEDITTLQEKILSTAYTSVEKEQLQRKLVLLKIDLAEAQTRMAYLKEEEGTALHREATNEETTQEGMRSA